MGPDAKGKVRVIAIARSALDRKALGALLPQAEGIELVAVCATANTAAARLRKNPVDVLAVDHEAVTDEQRTLLRQICDTTEAWMVEFPAAATPEDTCARAVKAVLGLEAPLPVGDAPSPVVQPPPPPRVALVPRVVAIGSSTGGPEALADFVPRLPAGFPATVLIAQHMPAAFTRILARRLTQRSQLDIHEARTGEPLRPGTVLLAPGDFHLEVEEGAETVRLHKGPPENSCRPAVDVLFRSVARRLGARSLGVVLTGMGRDGLAGAALLRGAGAEVFVQDEESSVVWGMPGLIAQAGLANAVAPLPELARRVVDRVLPPHRPAPSRPHREDEA